MELDDPRRCPACGTMGKRPYRDVRHDGFGIRLHYRCPSCGKDWNVRMRRVGTAGNPLARNVPEKNAPEKKHRHSVDDGA